MSATYRLLIWLFLVAAATVSTPAAALSLGSPQVYSVLGEPIDARLPIEGSQPGATYTVRVASDVEFHRLGLVVPGWIRNITVTTEQGPDGRSYVRLGSRVPMHEPLVSIVLELTWGGGRMLREVTLLFDPPSLRRSAPLPVPRSPAAMAPPRRVSPARAAGQTGTRTRPNDTLWGLAARLRPAGVSQQSMMDALLRANPQAFVDGDPNRLRAGVALQVPSLSNDRVESKSVAAAAQPAALARASPQPAQLEDNAETASANGALRVLSPEETGAAEPLDELHAQLHIVRAEVATRRAQNQAMLDRVAKLEEHSTALLRELERKERAAAQLRAKLSGETAAVDPNAESPDTASATVKTDTPAPAPAPRVDAWRGWLLVAAALIVGGLAAGILLFVNARRARRPLANDGFDQDDVKAPNESTKGRSNYAPSKFAETSAALAGVLADDETKADPMVEVAFLKNFGRWDQAEGLLRELINQFPDRDDYRFELLELYYRTENEEAFVAFAEALQPSLSRRAPGLWSEVVRMGQRLDPSAPLFNGGATTDRPGVNAGDESPKSASG